ncbi:MAG: hypothetical protein GQ564_22300 [Bacteroidales bacterium]|nr:hypothetical protein [Bacteroidales bacterium]
MRKRANNKYISVHAIAGTEVVLLGLNAEEEAITNLLGFNIFKKKDRDKEYRQLSGGRGFEKSTSDNKQLNKEGAPIQAFMWSDYVVDPNTSYTYKIVPIYGNKDELKPGEALEINIKTEDPEDNTHAIFFNRGVAGSQAYSRKFGNYRRWYEVENYGRTFLRDFIKPKDVPNREAFKWLSRGLEEAMKGFINQAKDSSYTIRAAVYEFTYIPVIQSFAEALERGVDVKIIHHAKRQKSSLLKRDYDTNVSVVYKDDSKKPDIYKSKNVVVEVSKDSVCKAADTAVSQIGLKNPEFKDAFESMMIERTDTQISHNKFIILLKDGKPVQVWTGSTNYTDGGIFGQSNVGHIIRNEEVAQKYYEYWQKLSTDPKRKSNKSDSPDAGIANWTVNQQADLVDAPPPNSITPIFSPRLTNAMLNWYADRLAKAKNSVFFTAAFSVADEIFEKVKVTKDTEEPYLRYLLLEGISGLIKPKYPQMAKCPQNQIAWGETLKTRKGEKKYHQFIETLTGLNDHVNYLHTKYMLIDPLSDDPIIITGSANFSDASTTKNDENMVIIRGNTRVADIFLGEFMRLFNHFKSRNVLNKLSDEEIEKSAYLCNDDSWTKTYYTKNSKDQKERLLFS